jgi:glycosyltransferase involved in cell wall biosynthesis
VAAHAGKYLGIPSVVSIRGNDIDRAAFDPGKFSHFMHALQRADAVTANAKVLVDKAKALIDRDIFLIPNGIDSAHFKPMERNPALAESLGIAGGDLPNEAAPAQHAIAGKRYHYVGMDSSVASLPKSGAIPVIGFVGELRKKKGIEVLLSAYARVYKEHQSALLIVGTIRQSEDKQLFDEFCAANPDLQIIVTGYISPGDLPSYYALVDIFVHPSLRDGMPNAVLEAMACGRAVIATPVGGVPDLIRNGENGVLIPAEDPDALASVINSLLGDPDLRLRLGKAGRETVAAQFSLKKELDGNMDVYRKLGLNP